LPFDVSYELLRFYRRFSNHFQKRNYSSIAPNLPRAFWVNWRGTSQHRVGWNPGKETFASRYSFVDAFGDIDIIVLDED
jgi:hypothetical protein